MHRTMRSLALAAVLVVATAGTALAAPQAKGCANAASGFTSITLNFEWAPGQPVPGPGQDAWWDLTLAGFAAEGLSAEAAATAFGFESVAALYEVVALGIRGVDKNGDHAICWKGFPDQAKGTTAYTFNAVDNNAR